MRWSLVIRLLSLLALSAMVGLGGGAAGAVDRPTLVVDVQDGDYPEFGVTLETAERGVPARLVLYVPRGFLLYPNRPEGSPIGGATLFAADDFGSASLLTGQIVAVRNAPDAAPGCGPAPRDALWQLELSLVGQRLEVPIAVSTAGIETRLDFCIPALPSAGGALLPIRKLALTFDDLVPPTVPGRYLWRAVVTPLAPDKRTALEDRRYEVRALVPVPHVLSLRGRYVAGSRTAVLTGRLAEGGVPHNGARIEFISLVRRITPKGVRVDDSYAGWTRTNASGTYTFRKKIRRTTGFLAFVEKVVGGCAAGPVVVAPAGCLSTTTTGLDSEPVTVSVPAARR